MEKDSLHNYQQVDIIFENKVQISETACVFRFLYKPDTGFNFSPGQYVWLVLSKLVEDDPRGERRALSIISSNQEKKYIEFLIRISDSGFKKTLLNMKEGDTAAIVGPFGSSFVIPPDNTHDIVFIAGGVAVAPFLGIVNSLTNAPPYRLRMVHYYSSDESKCDLNNLSNSVKKYDTIVTDIQGSFSSSNFPNDINFLNTTFFVTGPQGFINAVDPFLKNKGTSEENIHYEENYPEPEGNLTESDFDLKKNKDDFMLTAVMDSKSHTIITDANGKIIFANPKAEKNTGYKFSEMRGNTPRLWGGVMSRQFYQSFWKRKHTQEGFDGEILNRKKNGDEYIVMTHISPLKNDKNVVIGYIGTEEDITAERNQKIQLEAQNKELEDNKLAMINLAEDLEIEKKTIEREKKKDEIVLSSIGEGLMVTNEKGQILLANPAFEEILGWSASEVLGKKLSDVVTIEDDTGKILNAEERPMGRVLSTAQKVRESNLFYLRKDGKKVPVDMTVTPNIIDGKLSGVIEVFKDVTREREIDKAKTEFISLASHQLRTPLSTINWYCEMLLAGDAGAINDQQKEFLQEAYGGSQRMVKLVNSLLNVSRIETGRFMVEPEEVDPVALARAVLEESKPMIDNKNLQVKLENQEIPKIMLDPNLATMIFQNLLTNSVKYTHEGGSIKVKLRIIKTGEQIAGHSPDVDSLLIQVSDNGMGIPQSQQTQVFQKLFRADNVRKTDTEGTGLGLYLIKSLIEHSKGKIWFESVEGQGTTFYVIIPLSGMVKKEGEKRLT